MSYLKIYPNGSATESVIIEKFGTGNSEGLLLVQAGGVNTTSQIMFIFTPHAYLPVYAVSNANVFLFYFPASTLNQLKPNTQYVLECFNNTLLNKLTGFYNFSLYFSTIVFRDSSSNITPKQGSEALFKLFINTVSSHDLL